MIVIIAILATLIVTTYRGLQQRAENSKTIALASNWEKSIRLYKTTSRKLPNDWTCLGQSVNEFPAVPAQSIGLGQCERNMILINPSPDWTSEFKTVPTPGQTLSTPELLSGNASLSMGALAMHRAGTNSYMRGIVYAVIYEPERAPNNTPGAYLFYSLKNQPCPSGREYRTFDSISVCAFKLTSSNYANEVYQP